MAAVTVHFLYQYRGRFSAHHHFTPCSPAHLPVSVCWGFAFTGESRLLIISRIWLLLYVCVCLPYKNQLCSTMNHKEVCSITLNHIH